MAAINYCSLALIILIFPALILAGAKYPVPTPAGGRNAVHGWLILPVDQPVPADPYTPVPAYFVHHTPEFWTDSPHNFQLILFGAITPLGVAENITDVIELPYPPSSALVSNEFTITPPPPFSLNDLLNGQINSLLGVVYNGSFDTSYERSAMAIANLKIETLVTAVWLNYSSAIPNYPQMRYLSYPRSAVTTNNQGILHFYLSHEIHSPPDFDQVVHVSVNLSTCVCQTSACNSKWLAESQVPGAEWAFSDVQNDISARFMPSAQPVVGVLMSGASQVTCAMEVLEEIHCVLGPGFGTVC